MRNGCGSSGVGALRGGPAGRGGKREMETARRRMNTCMWNVRIRNTYMWTVRVRGGRVLLEEEGEEEEEEEEGFFSHGKNDL